MPSAPAAGPSKGASVLITDANARGMLAAARTLAAAGFRVGAVAALPHAATHWSIAARGRYLAPDPRAEPEAFVEALARIASGGGYAALIPGSDAALRAISEWRSALPSSTVLGLPPASVVADALDKLRLTDLAREAGLPQPRSATCATVDEASAAAEAIGYPVVLKPHSTVFLDGDTLQQRSSRIVCDRADLVRSAPDYGSPLLVQEHLSGPTYSLAGVLTEDGMPAAAMARYDRTWPPVAGNAAFATTVSPRWELLAEARRLLELLGWRGLFELEYIARTDGGFVPIDLNPRPYGSLALASAAGAPLAVVWTRLLLGERPAPVVARPGFHYRWEDADLRNLIWTVRRDGPVRAFTAFRPRRRTVHAYFRLTDPAPLAARALELGCRTVRRRARGRGRSGPRRLPRPRRSRPPRDMPA